MRNKAEIKCIIKKKNNKIECGSKYFIFFWTQGGRKVMAFLRIVICRLIPYIKVVAKTFWGYSNLFSCKQLIFFYNFQLNDQPSTIRSIYPALIFEFHKRNNTTVAIKNICDVYANTLDVRKCPRWCSKFKSGNFDPYLRRID